MINLKIDKMLHDRIEFRNYCDSFFLKKDYLIFIENTGFVHSEDLFLDSNKGVNWIIFSNDYNCDLNELINLIEVNKFSLNSKYLFEIFGCLGECIFSWHSNKYLHKVDELFGILNINKKYQCISSYDLEINKEIDWKGCVINDSKYLSQLVLSQNINYLENKYPSFILNTTEDYMKEYFGRWNVIGDYHAISESNVMAIKAKSKQVYDILWGTAENSANSGYAELMVPMSPSTKLLGLYESYYNYIFSRTIKNYIYSNLDEVLNLNCWQFYFHTSCNSDLGETVFLCSDSGLMHKCIENLNLYKNEYLIYKALF